MRAIIQRVSSANVIIEGKIKGEIEDGMVVLLGIEESDSEKDIEWLVSKIVQVRLFNDQNGLMNRSIVETKGNILLISQFTLYGSIKKGNRPSFIRAAKSSTSKPIYEHFIEIFEQKLGKSIQTGTFGADMKVSLTNDGPVTLLMDSKNIE